MRASTRRLPSWWSHGSLRADRILKARLYARAGIGDYWIVNLVDRVLASPSAMIAVADLLP